MGAIFGFVFSFLAKHLMNTKVLLGIGIIFALGAILSGGWYYIDHKNNAIARLQQQTASLQKEKQDLQNELQYQKEYDKKYAGGLASTKEANEKLKQKNQDIEQQREKLKQQLNVVDIKKLHDTEPEHANQEINAIFNNRIECLEAASNDDMDSSNCKRN